MPVAVVSDSVSELSLASAVVDEALTKCCAGQASCQLWDLGVARFPTRPVPNSQCCCQCVGAWLPWHDADDDVLRGWMARAVMQQRALCVGFTNEGHLEPAKEKILLQEKRPVRKRNGNVCIR